jgi:dephospho-CoA kinase
MKKPDHFKKTVQDALEQVICNSGSMLVALTGGVATGKSTVAEIFRTLGAVIIDFDILARTVVEPGKKPYELITGFFGEEILNPDKTISRKRLSAIVFNDQVKRKRLESFTHPYIWDEFTILAGKAASRNKKAIILGVIPLLIEGGMDDLFSKVILVYSSPETQLNRLMKRDSITRERAQKILDAQMPIDQKISHANFVINNNNTILEADKEVRQIWEKLNK